MRAIYETIVEGPASTATTTGASPQSMAVPITLGANPGGGRVTPSWELPAGEGGSGSQSAGTEGAGSQSLSNSGAFGALSISPLGPGDRERQPEPEPVMVYEVAWAPEGSEWSDVSTPNKPPERAPPSKG